MMKMKWPLASIVVPILNSEKTIKECLNSLMELDYPHYEVIVVDGGSNDSTIEIAKSFEKVKLFESNPPAGRQRNKGVFEAKGKYIAFTDSDCIVSKDWLKNLIEIFMHFPDASEAGGPNTFDRTKWLSRGVQKVFEKSIGSHYAKSHNKITKVSHASSCNLAIKKDVFEELGGFNDELFPGEDIEFDSRLIKTGHKIYFTPKATLVHKKNYTLGSFSKQMFAYGKVKGWLFKKKLFFSFAHLLPSLFVIYLASLPFLDKWFYLPLIGYLGYSLLSVKGYFFLFPIQHISYGLGFFTGIFKK